MYQQSSDTYDFLEKIESKAEKKNKPHLKVSFINVFGGQDWDMATLCTAQCTEQPVSMIFLILGYQATDLKTLFRTIRVKGQHKTLIADLVDFIQGCKCDGVTLKEKHY